MVILCVILISISGKAKEEDTSKINEDQTLYKVLTIVFAILAGLVLAFNSMELHSCLKLGADPLQMNIDCFFVYGLFLIPFFAYEQVNYNRFDLSDFLWMGLFVLTVTLGTISLTKALEIGLAGPI